MIKTELHKQRMPQKTFSPLIENIFFMLNHHKITIIACICGIMLSVNVKGSGIITPPSSDITQETERLKKELASIETDNDETGKYWVKKISNTLDGIQQASDNRGTELKESNRLDTITMLQEIIYALKNKMITNKSFITYEVNPLRNDTRILPDTIAIHGKISNNIRIMGCPGEYEAASVAVKAFDDIKNLLIQATDLKSEHGTISASNIDIRIVKCWYVGGNSKCSTFIQTARFMAPELLLKDDSSIKINSEKKANYIKLVFNRNQQNEKIEYRCISDYPDTANIPKIKQEAGIKYYWGVPFCSDAFPVKDSKELLPVNIQTNTNKQFWITVKIPDDAAAGIYSGKIKISTSDKNDSKNLEISLKVLPFKLSRLPTPQSIYYGSDLDLAGSGGVGTGYKSKNLEQYTNEMKDLVAHGITNPQLHLTWWDKKNTFDHNTVAKMLEIRKNAGADMSSIYLKDSNVPIITDPKEIKRIQAAAKELSDFIISQGYGTQRVYFYGKDEAVEAIGNELSRQRPLWEAIQQAGSGTLVSGFLRSPSNFDLLGDIQDAIALAWEPSPEEAARWHSKGHKIFCYANPQTGLEFPETYRRNYGLVLWQNNYDGGMNNAYMSSYNNPWNDFDCCNRDETMAYPTVDGVIDTIEWEGNREGIDDWRYIITLQDILKSTREKNNNKDTQTTLSAEKFLERLKKKDLCIADLDVIRLESIKHILALLGDK